MPLTRLPGNGIATYNIGGAGNAAYGTFTYHRRNDASGFTLTLQRSTDLQSWHDAKPFLVLMQTTDNRDGTSSFLMREATPLSSASGPRFYRTRVTVP